MLNKLLTIEDLMLFCEKNKLSHFSSEKENMSVVLSTFGEATYSATEDPCLMAVTLKSCHTGLNRNKSSISEEVMTAALPSFSNKPILAEIVDTDDGKDFGSHAMEYYLDENDEQRVKYIEKCVGIIPESCNARLEYDKKKDKTYTVVDGYIYTEYGNETADIIKRKNGTKVSVELLVNDFSYDAKNKNLVINDFTFSGVTLLGEAVGEGMEGSRLDMATFTNTEELNNKTFEKHLIEMQEKLDTLLSMPCFTINQNQEKGGENVTYFETLLQKYSKTTEDITFEIENLSDEELEAKFIEAFGEVDETTDEEETVEETVEEVEEGSEDNGEEEPVADEVEEVVEEVQTEEGFEEEQVVEEVAEEVSETKFSRRSLENGDLELVCSLSHEDIRSGLYALIGTYEDLDNDFYYIESVYDDHFVMSSWCTGAIYGQKYAKDGDNLSLDGERYALFRELLTESEKAKLEKMRADYSVLEEKVANYEKAELDAQKDAVFADESYADFLETAEFKELIQNKDNYSVDELRDKCELTFAKLVRTTGSFCLKREKPVEKQKNKISFSYEREDNKEYDPYPGLF